MPTSTPTSSNMIPRLAFPPGLEATQGPDAVNKAYVPISFSSKREYADDSEGWTQVKRAGGKRKKHQRGNEYYMY